MGEYYRKSNDLYHWGIKGMKWGKRRYQNSDGTLTPAGEKRYAKEQRALDVKKTKDKGTYTFDAGSLFDDDLERTRTLANSGKQLSGDVKRLVDKSMKKAPRERLDLSNMTDQELRERINREMLERQYNDVFNPPQISKGKAFTADLLETAGDVLAVAGSAILVAQGIRAFRTGG